MERIVGATGSWFGRIPLSIRSRLPILECPGPALNPRPHYPLLVSTSSHFMTHLTCVSGDSRRQDVLEKHVVRGGLLHRRTTRQVPGPALSERTRGYVPHPVGGAERTHRPLQPPCYAPERRSCGRGDHPLPVPRARVRAQRRMRADSGAGPCAECGQPARLPGVREG